MTMTEQEEMIERLRFAIYKMSKWSGVDVADLIEEDYLKEGDMG